jgi:integrase/recombinase XerD
MNTSALAVPDQPIPADVRRLRWPLRHPATLYLLRLSEGARSTQVSALRRVAHFLGYEGANAPTLVPWHELGPEHCAAVRAYLAQHAAPATANRILTALRGVLKSCARLDLFPARRAELLAEELHRVPGDSPKPGRFVPTGELAALLRAAGTTPRGARDRAALALLFGCGLRRAEAVSIDLADLVDEEGPTVIVRKGKGRKSRRVPIPPSAWTLLVAWRAVRGEDPGPLLTPVYASRYGAAVVVARLGRWGLHRALARLQATAGIAKLTSHDLRRTWISTLLETADLATVQALAGHSNSSVTVGYDRRPAATRRRAVAAIELPSE